MTRSHARRQAATTVGNLRPQAPCSKSSSAAAAASADYLTGDRPFEAKLNPAYAPYEDYDQLMRLQEWYGRD